MTSFVKPENALKRAEELLDVGKQNEALETLHHAILHKRWKNQWSPTLEKIIERHLQLCVELQKMRFAREGLHQYRATCQAANIQSLEQVVRVFRKAAEEKVNQAKKEQDVRLGKVADLEEMDAPETILLQAIQAGDTRQQSQDKDVHTHFRFLWETYKVILDVLKSNSRLEEVYHETSRQAFEFCRANTRPQEFKRLCDILRKNFTDLSKRTGPTGQNPVQPNNVDTITKTLETRCRQMQVATELDLWREAYNTSSEICDLMTALGKVNQRPKPHLRSMYYEHLGQIFWKSENYLFHAFASLKNVFFVKGAKQNMPKSELELLASRAVLAMLCVPFQENSDIQASLEMSTDGSHQYEKAKKNAFLFSAQSVPTRDSISSQITEKNLLNLAAEPCAKLFGLVESDFTPLSLCQDAKPYLDQIASDEICEGKLKDYVIPLKQIIFFRLIKQLSEVYVSMTIEDFENAASIVPFNIAETWMANASRQQGISIQINYMQKAIIFGAPTKVDMKSMRQPLIEIGYKLQQAMQCVAQEELQRKDKLEKQHLLTNIKERMEQETRSIRQRKEEIERRKEESERRKQILEREAMERQRKEEALEAEKERRRQEEERKRREVEKQEQRKKEAELQKNMEMLEQMKKQAEQKATNLKVAGKKITEIEADDLTNISFDQIEKAREAQVLKERQDKIRQRKAESKRVDHLARALREEESSLLKQWSVDVEKVDAEQLEKFESAKQEEQRKQHENLLKEKQELLPFQHVKDSWAEQQLEPRRADWEDMREAQIHRLTKKVVQNKIARAMQRRDQHVKEENDAKEKEKRRQQEEERRRRQEIEEQEEAERQERLKQEREEKRAAEEARRKDEEERRERAEEKRREREREIEEREAQAAANRRAGGAGGAGGAAAGGAGDSWRRGGDAARDAPSTREDWRKRGEPAEEGPRRPAGGRTPQTRADEDNWRRPAADEPRGDAAPERKEPWRPSRAKGEGRDGENPGPWRPSRGKGEGREERDEPRGGKGGGARGGDDEGSWRRPPAGGGRSDNMDTWRRDEAPRRQGSQREEDGGFRRSDSRREEKPADEGPRRAPPREEARAPAREERPAPAPEPAAPEPAGGGDDDEGWGVVAGKKKRGKAAGGGEAPAEESEWRTQAPRRGGGKGNGNAGGEEQRPTPPWKANKK
ncbi:eif3a [Symbiodinium natans]|uniref:Eif3a protein n=1 Tax=Symbiodinium natans TaxID=878477 RepID=A0A812IA87_9DINO|nr:eif3a [Symbiodinium natans]